MAQLDDILDYELNPEETPEHFVAAGFWQRAVAVLLDVVLVGVITGIFSMGMVSGVFHTVLTLLIGLASLLYRPVMEYLYGATLGKMVIKIRVINTEGEPMTVRQTLVRNSFYISHDLLLLLSGLYFVTAIDVGYMTVGGIISQLTSLVGVLTLVSCLFVAFRENGQALHDTLADTYVIKNPERIGVPF